MGKPGKSRLAAARTLRWLADKAGTEVVAIAAETYGAKTAAAIKALIESEGGEELPKVLPKVPRWAESFALPQIALKQAPVEQAVPADSVAGLPPDAVHHLGQPLAGGCGQGDRRALGQDA